jgi:hypothetical protein
MTSRDFGFTTLRSAVAYRRNNTLVPPNNVYITSTNGAAIFSDTLTISTINVSTINGGGGGVSSISSGINISTSGTASDPIINVYINSTLDMNNYGILNCNNLTSNTSPFTISTIGNVNISSNNGTGAVNINGNLVVLSSAITQQIVTSSITTTPVTLDSGFFGKYTFVNTNVAATITLPSSASEGSVLIFKNLMTNAASTITISPVYSGGTISADTAASYVFTTYAGNSWVSF